MSSLQFQVAPQQGADAKPLLFRNDEVVSAAPLVTAVKLKGFNVFFGNPGQGVVQADRVLQGEGCFRVDAKEVEQPVQFQQRGGMLAFAPEAAEHLLLTSVAVKVVGSGPVPDVGERLGSVQMHGPLVKAVAQIGEGAGAVYVDALEQIDDVPKALHVDLHVVVDGDVQKGFHGLDGGEGAVAAGVGVIDLVQRRPASSQADPDFGVPRHMEDFYALFLRMDGEQHQGVGP